MEDKDALWMGINRVLKQGGLKSLQAAGIKATDIPELLTIGKSQDHRVLLGLPEGYAAGPVAVVLALVGQAMLEAEEIQRQRDAAKH